MITDQPASVLRGKKVLILGLGILRGGIGTALYCARHGARLRITDVRSETILRPSLDALRDVEAEYILGHHREEDIEWADIIFRNPGVPPSHQLLHLAASLGKAVDMEVAYFARHCRATMYFVTGTKGKTTTTTIMHRFLSDPTRPISLAGNMGEAAMTLLDDLGPDDEALLEVSSYQLEGLEGRGAPIHVAVITNVDDDHLDRYGTIERYRRVKLSIAEGQGVNDWLILPAWDRALVEASAAFAAQKVYVRDPHAPTHGDPETAPAAIVSIEGDSVVWRSDRKRVEIANLHRLKLLGSHNRVNTAFAAAAAFAAGRRPSDLTDRVAAITPVPHRLEPVGQASGVDFINDSAASAPLAVVAALDALAGRRAVVIVGGQDKAADYSAMATKLAQTNSPLVLLPGSATEKLRRELDAINATIPQTHAASMADAVTAAWRIARTTPDISVVLLSPGAASFGLFVNEFDRGDQFRARVHQLIP